MLSIYTALPAAAARHLRAICEYVASGQMPLLIPCTAGKDRTGFMCAALLKVLGVAQGDIVEDYLASGARVSLAVAAATRRLIKAHAGDGISEGAMEAITGVSPEFLQASFAAIEKSAGSFDGYLEREVGLDADMLGQVRAALVE